MKLTPEELGHECAGLIAGLSPGLTPEELDLALEEHAAAHPDHRYPPTRIGDPDDEHLEDHLDL